MFTEEDKKPGEEAPAPASEETPSEAQPNETPAEETPAEETPAGDADQSAEIQNLKNQITNLQGYKDLSDKQIKQLEQAGFNIEKYKNLLKENDIDIDEPSGISEERVAQIVAQAQGPLLEEIKTMGKIMSEISRGNVKPNANGGDPGQTPPPKPKEPTLPAQARQVVTDNGLVWTGKGYVYKSPKTNKIYDFLEGDSK